MLLVTTALEATFKFNYHTASGKKEIKEIDVDSFVGIKGWKSIGNKVNFYKRMSAHQVIEKSLDLEGPDIDTDINDDEPGTLNLFD